MKKNWRKVPDFIQHSWTFPNLILYKDICSKNVDVWLKIGKLNH